MGSWSQDNTGVCGVPGPREGAASRAALRGREGREGRRVHVASGDLTRRGSGRETVKRPKAERPDGDGLGAILTGNGHGPGPGSRAPGIPSLRATRAGGARTGTPRNLRVKDAVGRGLWSAALILRAEGLTHPRGPSLPKSASASAGNYARGAGP